MPLIISLLNSRKLKIERFFVHQELSAQCEKLPFFDFCSLKNKCGEWREVRLKSKRITLSTVGKTHAINTVRNNQIQSVTTKAPASGVFVILFFLV